MLLIELFKMNVKNNLFSARLNSSKNYVASSKAQITNQINTWSKSEVPTDFFLFNWRFVCVWIWPPNRFGERDINGWLKKSENHTAKKYLSANESQYRHRLNQFGVGFQLKQSWLIFLQKEYWSFFFYLVFVSSWFYFSFGLLSVCILKVLICFFYFGKE